MNVYDDANNLARAIKESKEYLEYKQEKEKVMADPNLKQKIEEFEKTRYEVQVLSIQGDQQNQEKIQKLQELYNVLVQNPVIKTYFDCEVRFNVMLADVNKIIDEAVKDVLK